MGTAILCSEGAAMFATGEPSWVVCETQEMILLEVKTLGSGRLVLLRRRHTVRNNKVVKLIKAMPHRKRVPTLNRLMCLLPSKASAPASAVQCHSVIGLSSR